MRYDSIGGVLRIDVDGDGTQDMRIVFTAKPVSLLATDLWLTVPAAAAVAVNSLAATTLAGGDDDLLTGTADHDLIGGGEGDDTIFGLAGNDTVSGDFGNDLLDGGADIDTLSFADTPSWSRVTDYGAAVFVVLDQGYAVGSGIGLDTVSAFENVVGSAGIDFIIGDSADNSISGGNSNDTLGGGFSIHDGDDTLDGGPGLDFARYLDAKNPIVADLRSGVATGIDIGRDLLIDMEVVLGSFGGDEIYGNDDKNWVDGGFGGNDTLYAFGGDDSLIGGSGSDILDGGAGQDTMDGDPGNDTFYVDSTGDVVREDTETDAGSGEDTVYATVSFTLPFRVEHLILAGEEAIDAFGNGADNRLTGNAAANVLDGGGGLDTLTGGDGADTYVVDTTTDLIVEAAGGGLDRVLSSVSFSLDALADVENLTLLESASAATGNAGANLIFGNAAANLLQGGAGADTLWGYSGADSIDGGAGNDSLIGGRGNDSVSGGTGQDVFRWQASTLGVDDLAAGVADTIVAVAADADRLDFTAAVDGALRAGDVALSAWTKSFTIGSSFSPGATNLRFDAAAHALQVDLNGNGTFVAAEDFQILLPGIAKITFVASGDYFLLG